MEKANQFQDESFIEGDNLRQTVERHSEILGPAMVEGFRGFHNGWMEYLNVWAQDPAGPAAKRAYADLEETYRRLSSLSRQHGFTPIASIFQDPATAEAPDNSAMLWRYLDKAKFTDLLTTCSLYLCRVDLFGEPFEGSIPTSAITHDIFPMPIDRRFLNHFFYANCWHMNSHESVAMWKLYLGDNEGVAIQTRAGRLASSLAKPRHGRLDAGCVEYLDYETGSFDWVGPINAYFRKRVEYRHEMEYRIVYHHFPPDYHSEANRRALSGRAVRASVDENNVNIPMPPGIRVPIDLSCVERVVMSPSSSHGFHEWVTAIVSDTGFGPSVVRSALENRPKF
jgi:hypothetical protein